MPPSELEGVGRVVSNCFLESVTETQERDRPDYGRDPYNQ